MARPDKPIGTPECDPRPTNPSAELPIISSCQPSASERRLPRRHFLQVSGVGLVATAFGSAQTVMAGDFSPADLRGGRLIPADKKLDPGWVRGLLERGEKEIYEGDALANIGMPCGGIGAGQLYLCGDGTLGSWQIFNNAKSNWVDQTHSTYTHRGIPRPLEQGFEVAVTRDDGTQVVRKLCRGSFEEIKFNGQYPIGTVHYRDDAVPVDVTLEAFSPFIPLNMHDSGLPATLFHITVENRSNGPVRASVHGWLENAVCHVTGPQLPGLKVTQVRCDKGRGSVAHSVREVELAKATEPRSTQVFEDFEGGNYKGWTVEGKGFGAAPATGTFTQPQQQSVSNFAGSGLVNTFRGGDAPQGKMTSRPFTIDRHFINLKVGGGAEAGKTCVNLLVDGKPVRSATGRNTEKLDWVSWHVAPLEGKTARLEIVDHASGGWGHILVDQIELSDTARGESAKALTEAPDFGTMTLACLDPAESADAAKPGSLDRALMKGLIETGSRSVPLDEPLGGLLRTTQQTLAAGQKHTFTFVLAWHFPNAQHGQAYAERFRDATAVANYLLDHHDRLAGQTRLWRDTYYDSSLPYWLLDRLHSTVSTLATGTCQWWGNGRFWAYEGVTCCEGTCTHVWNYAHAHARLFPELARNIRTMQDFSPRSEGGGFHEDSGLVGFRSNDAYAADGQCGTILKAYREHQMAPDSSFLRGLWPRIKKALEFSIKQDANADGLIENTQHNTYDINYEGANTFVGALYLAALRAGEAMAREVGDQKFADRCHAIFQRGAKLTAEQLWNGEYFVQDVDLKKHPKNQYGQGCLSDQLFGQGWAHQVGLGYLYPQEMVRAAIRAVWRYNWAPDITPYNDVHKPFRWFISPEQAGLLICTWPKSDYLPAGTLYKNEVWTGIEYQVAGHLIAEGMLTEGLAICRAVHDRYQPQLINPYNEVECGDHYARALASWGVYLALAGFEYHGPQGRLGFAPRITPEDFKTAFTAAEGWGTLAQTRHGKRQTNQIDIRWGKVKLKTLVLAPPSGTLPTAARVTAAGKTIAAKVAAQDDRVVITFDRETTLNAGDSLKVEW